MRRRLELTAPAVVSSPGAAPAPAYTCRPSHSFEVLDDTSTAASDSDSSGLSADSVPPATPQSDRHVEEASEGSFPASDPPPFTHTRSGRADRRPTADDAAEPLTPMKQWASDFIGALDDEAPDAVAALLTEDVAVRWGEAPVLVGRDAAMARLVTWFTDTGPLVRHVTDVRGDDEAVFIELEVTGSRDAVEGSWPEAISARLRSGLASRVTVYGPRLSAAPPTRLP